MKRITAGIAFFILGAVPAFAVDPPAQGTKSPSAQAGTLPGDAQARPMRQMMHSPQHLLMMAYHRNVASFGQALYLAAEEGSTVPAQVARAAVAEMRRSTEEMEKQRALMLRDAPVSPDRQKMLDDHLVQVKTQLRQLEELVKQDRIDAAEIRKHLQAVFEECEGAGCEMMPGAMHGSMQGGRYPAAHGYGAMGGCRCQSPHRKRGMMMQRMMQKVKSQDAELAALVQEMRGAPRDRKVDLLEEAVAAMVQQRAELTAEMERMQAGMMRGTRSGMMQQGGEEYECECQDYEETEDDAP